MANTSTPRGMIPYRYFDGSPYTGQANVYYASASYAFNIFVGDPVISIASQNDANGIPAVNLATAAGSNRILGTMVGIVNAGNPQITVLQNLPIYRPASTAQYILVADDPRLMFWIQDDGSGSTLNQWPSKNASLIAGSGNTVTGYSGWQLQGSSIATTSTLQLRVMRLLDTPDATGNAQPPTANAKWLVKINTHQLADGVAGTA